MFRKKLRKNTIGIKVLGDGDRDIQTEKKGNQERERV